MKGTGGFLGRSLGFWSFVALVLGLSLGLYGFETGSGWVVFLARVARPVGALWINSLQMAVVPLVVLQLLTAVTMSGRDSGVGSAGRRTLLLIVGLFLSLAAISYSISVPLVRLYHVSPETVEAIRESVLIPATAQVAAEGVPSGLGDWIQNLVPTNALEAVIQGNLIQILFVTVLFGLAVGRLPEEKREPLARIFSSLSQSVMILIRWILRLTPLGVFALVVGLALGTGFGAVGLLGAFVLMMNGMGVLFIVALYPLTAVLGRVSMRAFARAAATPQLVALSTRSSLASLPAQIESGQEKLGFGATTSGFTLPLLAAALKVQPAFANPLRLMFLAHIFGVTISPSQFVTFTITILIAFSFFGVFSVLLLL